MTVLRPLSIWGPMEAFSTLMTSRAEFILSVECGEQYASIIRHNMSENSYTSYAVETAFIGAGGSAVSNLPRLTMDDLFRRHNIESVDLIKLDIEGSEFALFNSADWLQHVSAISMEVHPHYGDPNAILRSVDKYGFTYAVAGEDFPAYSRFAKQARYIYAWKNISSSSCLHRFAFRNDLLRSCVAFLQRPVAEYLAPLILEAIPGTCSS